MAYAVENVSAGLSLGQRFQSFRAEYAENRAKAKVYRETVRELQSLTARELSNLGIAHSTIRAIALEAAYGSDA